MILVDTNILVAVANGRDNNHRVVVDLLESDTRGTLGDFNCDR